MRRWLALLLSISLCPGCAFSVASRELAMRRGDGSTPRREAALVLAIAAAELALGATLLYASSQVTPDPSDDPPGSWSQGRETGNDLAGMVFLGTCGALLAGVGVGDTASGLLQLGTGQYVFETPEPED